MHFCQSRIWRRYLLSAVWKSRRNRKTGELCIFSRIDWKIWLIFFPRASERRVLPIVGVCLSSSHFLIIFTSSHPHIFTSSHLHICSSSHLHIFTSAHLHIFSSSHLHIFTSSHLHIFSSCPLALSFFSISLLKAGAGAVPTRRHETQPFRTKWGSIVKNCGKIAISKSSGATLSHETKFDRQKLR